MIEGVDFSWARPSGAALAAAGKRFVVRYVPSPGPIITGGKGLDAAEVADYRAHGIAICLVFETTPCRAKDGTAAGRLDATIARVAAAALGFPMTTPIYFAVDWDAQAADYPAIDAYLRGAASVLTPARIGVYGHANLMEHCAGARTASWFWQTYAWSYHTVYPNNHLYQYNNGQTVAGSQVDLTRAMQANYGQWAPPAAPVPAPKPPDTSTEDPNVRVVTVTIEKFPARTFTATVPLRRFSATAELAPITSPSPYTATVDGDVVISGNTSAPSGSGFYRLAAGGSAGRYILAAQVTLEA